MTRAKFIDLIGLVTLLVFYTSVGYMALTPKVSREYYEYYISKESDVSPALMNSLSPIEPSETYEHTSTKLCFKKGWSEAERTHRWSVGKLSTVVFVVDDPSKFEGRLKLLLFALDKQRLTIELNGNTLYSGTITGNAIEIKSTFHNSLLVRGRNTLVFRTPDAHKPNNGDRRVLGIALKSISVE